MASSRRRSRLVAGAWTVGTGVVVVVGGFAYDRMTAEPDLCEALAAEVPDAPAIPSADGQGRTAPHWSAVLTVGVAAARPDGPPSIVDVPGRPTSVAASVPLLELSGAVADDDHGYDAVRALLPSASRPVADRQRQRVAEPLDPSSSGAEVMADTEHLAALFADRCPSAP